ncbi:hypothetical protein GCM10020227_24440 [Streptomyces flavovirens]
MVRFPAGTLLRLAPPAPGVTHVMVWAEYGYSANLRLRDFTAATTPSPRIAAANPSPPNTAPRSAWSSRTSTATRAPNGSAASST